MAEFGRALLERAGVTRDVMPRPEQVPRQPSYTRVKRTAFGPDDGPYRSGAASSELVVTVNLGVPWIAVVLVGLFMLGTALVITRELGVNSNLAYGLALAVATGLTLVMRVRMRAQVRVDREGLYVNGAGRLANLPRKRLVAIDTCMVRTRVDSSGYGAPGDTTWLQAFQVRARTDDGTVHELIEMPSLADSWWLQAQLEAALALPATVARVVA
jgi:hypothetical protein